MHSVALIYPYYENPGMLERQVENWNSYSKGLAEQVRVVIVDDGSPKHPALPIAMKCSRLPISVFRIRQNIPWNQHGARNLGAKVVGGAPEWLYFSDTDIVLRPANAELLLSKKLSKKHYYTFERAFAPDFVERKYHCNTFLTTRDAYWRVGGYDEDYCGTYGGDGPFLRQLDALTPRVHLEDIVLEGYPETVVADANTREWERTGEYKIAYRKIFEAKRARRDERPKNPLRFEWDKQL